MTPKEKAKELVDKFYDTTPNEAFIDEPLVLSTPYSSWGQAKQCALIAVDEILNDYSYMQNIRNANSNQIHSRRVYWQEVKQEIKNI